MNIDENNNSSSKITYKEILFNLLNSNTVKPTVQDMRFYFEHSQFSNIQTIDNAAMFCAMIDDSILDYLVTMRTGIKSKELADKYLTTEYLISIFPRTDAIVHSFYLDPKITDLYRKKIQDFDYPNAPITENFILVNCWLECIKIVKVCEYIRTYPNLFQTVSMDNLSYGFLSEVRNEYRYSKIFTRLT